MTSVTNRLIVSKTQQSTVPLFMFIIILIILYTVVIVVATISWL